jgi:predicted acyl esterase
MIERPQQGRFGDLQVAIDELSPPKIGLGGYDGLRPRTETLHKGWQYDPSSKPLPCEILVEHDQAFIVRDGATLYADIYRPVEDINGSVPAILCWGPFGKKFNGSMSLKLMTPWNLGIPEGTLSGLETFEGLDPADWVPRGYAIINVDSRGSYDSEGVMCILGSQEAEDGHDVVELVAKLPWCNGNVGTAGNSHLAIVQWHIAAQNPPSLKAIAPWEGMSDIYREQFGRGGIYGGELFEKLIQKYMLKGTNGIESFKKMWDADQLSNAFWADKRVDMTKIDVPTYITGTWTNTMHGMGAIRGWLQTKGDKWLRWHPTQEWYDIWGNKESIAELMTFFDRYLKGIENEWELTPRVRMALLRFGDQDPISNVVVPDFPLPNTNYRKMYLTPSGSLASTPQSQRGIVSYQSQQATSTARFVHCFENRTRLLGIPKAILHMSCSSHNDLDVYIILKKLSRSGETLLSLNIPWPGLPVKSIAEIEQSKRTEVILYTGPIGILRASHREIDSTQSMHPNFPFHPHEREQKIPPGEIVRLEIGIWGMGIEYDAGESICLEISGAYPGIANFGSNEHTNNKGSHTIHVGGKFDSHIILPFVD